MKDLISDICRKLIFVTFGCALQYGCLVLFGKVMGYYDPYATGPISLAFQSLGRFGWLSQDIIISIACLMVPILTWRVRLEFARFCSLGIGIGFLVNAYYFLHVDPETAVALFRGS